MLLYLGRCAVATVHVAVEAPSFLSLQSCTRTLDRLYASTPSVCAKWYWVDHGRLTSEQSCTRTLDRFRTIMHSNTRQALERVDAFGLREMVLGKSRQAHQRTAGSPANAKLTFRYPSSLINHSTLLLERSSAKLLVFYASTRSRRAVEVIICMITRDFSVISIDVTGVSLSLSTTHRSHSRRT